MGSCFFNQPVWIPSGSGAAQLINPCPFVMVTGSCPPTIICAAPASSTCFPRIAQSPARMQSQKAAQLSQDGTKYTRPEHL